MPIAPSIAAKQPLQCGKEMFVHCKNLQLEEISSIAAQQVASIPTGPFSF
jgi:hypothetical protein